MLRFFAVATYIGGIFATLMVLIALVDDSAPRSAARAGMALAIVVIPYCLTKVFWMNSQREHQADIRKYLFRINTLLENSNLINQDNPKQQNSSPT